ETFPFSIVDVVVIVDDCCPVNSGITAKEIAEKYNSSSSCKIDLVKNEVNMGVGGAVKTGIKYILDNYKDVDYLVKIDGDGQMDPTEIVLFVEAASEADAD